MDDNGVGNIGYRKGLSASADFGNLVSSSGNFVLKDALRLLNYVLGFACVCLLVYFLRSMQNINNQKQSYGLGSKSKGSSKKHGLFGKSKGRR